MHQALVIVDVQNDFCPGGTLPVAGGDLVAALISEHIAGWSELYTTIVATKCWHPDDIKFAHFSADPDFDTTWPMHCVAGTHGAQFHPALRLPDIEKIFLKGKNYAAYSGFEGVTLDGVSLKDHLTVWDVEAIDVVGLATDYCVKATAVDGVKHGFKTQIISDLCAAVHPENTELLLEQLQNDHAILISTKE